MPLDLRNGKRPSQALQRAMGRGRPTLNDDQAGEFAALVEEHGGWPFGVAKAQAEFAERYEIKGEGNRRHWMKK